MITTSEKIQIILKRRNMSVPQLAQKLGQSSQNIYKKLKRDDFCESDLHTIAAALNCTYFCGFRMDDTGETI